MLCLCEVGSNLTIDKSFVYIHVQTAPDDTFSVVGKSFSFSPFYAICRSWAWESQAKGANMWLQSFILKRRGEGWWGASSVWLEISCFLHIETMYFLLLSRCAVFKVAVVHRFRRFFFSDTALCAEKILRKNNRSHGKPIRKMMLRWSLRSSEGGGRNTAVTCKVLLPSDVKNQVIKIKLTGNQNHQKSSLYFSRFWRVDWKARHSIGANHGQSDLRFRVCDLQTTSCLECFRFTRRHTISSTSFRPRRGLETTCDFLFSRCHLNLDPATLLAFCVKSNN